MTLVEREDEMAEKPSFESFLKALGKMGRYQKTQLALTFSAKLITTFAGLSFVFLGYTPSHICNEVNETSLLLDKGLDLFNNATNVNVMYNDECQVTLATPNESATANRKYDVVGSSDCLNGRKFYTTKGKPTTYISDWDLVCESMGIAELSQTIFILGQIVGGIVMVQLIDRIGRKTVFVFSTIGLCVFESLVIAMPSIYAIYGIKFLSGFCFQGELTSGVVFGIELLVPRHRQIYGVALCHYWVSQALIMGGVAYFLQDENWRYLQGVVAASGLVCILYPFIMTESLRWLASTNQRDRALVILQKACKQNKKNVGEVRELFDAFLFSEHGAASQKAIPLMNASGSVDISLPVSAKDEEKNFRPDEEIRVKNNSLVKTESMLTLFRTKRMCFVTFAAMYIWVTCNFTYFGLYMTSSSISGDRFLNFILMALVEIPSNLAITFMLDKLSRRRVLMTFLALSALSLMSSSMVVTFVEGYEYVTTILFIFGKFAITCAFNVTFIYTPELFPTNLRGVGTGFCNSFGRIGSMIAPFLRALYNLAPWAPGLVFTVMCVIALFLIPLLPETKDRNLLDQVQDDMQKEERETGKI